MILTDKTIRQWRYKIDLFTLEEMTWLFCLAPEKWEVFCNYELWKYFTVRWLSLGGKEKRNWKSKDLVAMRNAVDSGRLFGLLERPLGTDGDITLPPDVTDQAIVLYRPPTSSSPLKFRPGQIYPPSDHEQ